MVVRLYQLQIVRGLGYHTQTIRNVVHEKYVAPTRGDIYDRNGEKLATNRPTFTIVVTPKQFTQQTRRSFVRLLGLTRHEMEVITKKVDKVDAQSMTPIPVWSDRALQSSEKARQIARDRAATIAQEKHRLPGVSVRAGWFRHYPEGPMAAHLVGYVSQLRSKEYNACKNMGCRLQDVTGRVGVERWFEKYLHGRGGRELYATNAKGRRLGIEDEKRLVAGQQWTEPIAGHDVWLTLDVRLQRAAETASSHQSAVAVVVVDIHSGDILALVSRPGFDPNKLAHRLSHIEYDLLTRDPRKPFLDKTLRQHYAPGSTFKFVPALAALADGVIDKSDKQYCPGYHTFGGQKFRCTSRHGSVDLETAIKKSCNVYFWKLAEVVGLDRIADVATDFGFGVTSGVGTDGEVSGRIPTIDWYKKQVGRYAGGHALNAATGQGDVEVTVVQLAMAYAALVNGGELLEPHIVRSLRATNGTEILQYKKKVRWKVSVDPENIQALKRGMWKVVNAPGGTARRAKSSVITIAGKTGTAQVRRKAQEKPNFEGWHPHRDHAWFAGYAPAGDPEVVVVVLVEHGGSGGVEAAPIAKTILEEYARNYVPSSQVVSTKVLPLASELVGDMP